MNNKNVYWYILGIGIIFVIMLGVADWISIQYIYQHGWDGAHVWQTAYWMIAWFAVAFVGITLYLTTKSKALAIACVLFISLLILGGGEDIAFYATRTIDTGLPIDSQMCWFNDDNHLTIPTVSRILGEECVTPFSLIANVALFGIIGFVISRWLVEQDW